MKKSWTVEGIALVAVTCACAVLGATKVQMPAACTNPDGMAVDAAGRLVIAAPNIDRKQPGVIFRLDAPDAQPYKWLDVPAHPETGFASPMGICFGPDGALYVCDNQPDCKGRLLRATIKDDKAVAWETVGCGIENANGVKYLNGRLYLTQSFLRGEKRADGHMQSGLYAFNATDRNVRVANRLTDPQFVFGDFTTNKVKRGGLNGVAVTPDGTLYTGNYGDGRIWRLTLDANGRCAKADLFATGLASADGLCVDARANLYCADMLGCSAVKFTPDGRRTVLAKDVFTKPSEPCFWQGRLYVADYGATTLTVLTRPEPPGRDEWTFRQELATPVARTVPEKFRLVDDYGVTGDLVTARDDLADFLGGTRTLRLARGTVDGHESYRVDVAADGAVTLTAGDDDGLRRAIYHFEDRVMAGDLASCTRKPWLKHRITRCFFGPIKRPPYNRDELMDDMDYYPEAYLNRLAHEGVNGLWLTVSFRDLAETSFTKRAPDAEKRLAKLRRTVAKCLRYGIKTWIFGIEPAAAPADDPFVKAHPECFGGKGWNGNRVYCPAHPLTQQYLEETMRDIFKQVPGLGGYLNISNGERPTTCLSRLNPVTGDWTYGEPCPRCSKGKPWEIHYAAMDALARGMRASNPDAEVLSWFYHPQVASERAPWVYEAARHLPKGVTLLYNFESGAVREQAGRPRVGGDYWLSYTGPATPFARVAENAGAAGMPVGAKIQVGCSHENACVPFVPVPGLLWRKYHEMRKYGCTAVMQCWYFGNYPGVMNKAAGELAFEEFRDDENAFLARLARPEWRADADRVADLWKKYSDAYAHYPMSTFVQYYGPYHFGLAWRLFPSVAMQPMEPTWKPDFPPAGDTIGEALEAFTIDEALMLASRMSEGMEVKDAAGRDVLADLEAKYAGDRERRLDLGVMRTLRNQFACGRNVFEFYRLRSEALHRARTLKDYVGARRVLARMADLVRAERGLSAAQIDLCKADSRLGFHSEAEAHQFFPARLEWRIDCLDDALAEIARIDAALARGEGWPLSDFERHAPVYEMKKGDWTEGAYGVKWRARELANGDFAVEFDVPNNLGEISVTTFDAAAVQYRRTFTALKGGGLRAPVACDAARCEKTAAEKGRWGARIVVSAALWNGETRLRPGWIYVHGHAGGSSPVWPQTKRHPYYRLNLNGILGEFFGRLAW